MTGSDRRQWEIEGTRRLVSAVIRSGVREWLILCQVVITGKSINIYKVADVPKRFRRLIRFFKTDCNNLLPPGINGTAFLRELYKVPGAPKPPGERDKK